MVPLARTYRAKSGRYVWQPIRCQYCKCEFAYRVLISASGEGSSAFGLISIEAMGRAIDNAEIDLQNKMDDYRKRGLRISKIIPCPECGKLQKKMLQESKDARRNGLNSTLILAAIILLNPLSVSFYRENLSEPINWQSVYTPTILIPFGIFLIFFFIGLFRRKAGMGLAAIAATAVIITTTILHLVIGFAILLGLGIGYLIYENRLAFDDDPNAYADIQTPVLRRSELEALAEQLKAESGVEVPIPVWS